MHNTFQYQQNAEILRLLLVDLVTRYFQAVVENLYGRFTFSAAQICTESEC